MSLVGVIGVILALSPLYVPTPVKAAGQPFAVEGDMGYTYTGDDTNGWVLDINAA